MKKEYKHMPLKVAISRGRAPNIEHFKVLYCSLLNGVSLSTSLYHELDGNDFHVGLKRRPWLRAIRSTPGAYLLSNRVRLKTYVLDGYYRLEACNYKRSIDQMREMR